MPDYRPGVPREFPSIDRLPARPKILVVDLGFLGDTIHLLPALWVIRQGLPQAQVHVVTTPVGAEVLAMTRCVDRVWRYPLGRPSPPWWRHLDLQRELRRQRFDLAINLSGADRSLYVTAFSGSRCRVTRGGRILDAWQRWLAGPRLPDQPRTLPVFEQRRRCLEALGFAVDSEPRFDLVPPPPREVPVVSSIREGSIHLSISASTPFKEWPLEAWKALASKLVADGGVSLVATGSQIPREQERLSMLADTLPPPGLVVVRDSLTIAQLATVLGRCRGHVGTDSGVTHLAMALGLSTVSIFREYPGLSEWRPAGARHAALTAPCPCACDDKISKDCYALGTARCLAGIQPSDVIHEAKRLGLVH